MRVMCVMQYDFCHCNFMASDKKEYSVLSLQKYWKSLGLMLFWPNIVLDQRRKNTFFIK